MTMAWDPVLRAYFNGHALWTYLTTPSCSRWTGPW